MSPPIRARISGDYPERIKNIRKSRQLTQTQFADLLGVSYASVSRWENGHSWPNSRISQKILDLERTGDGDRKSVAPTPPQETPPGPGASPDPDAANAPPKPDAAPMPQATCEQEILRVTAVLEGNDAAKAAQTARYEILAWAQERTGAELPQAAWDHETFEYGSGDRTCAAVRVSDNAKDLWAVRAEEPDEAAAEEAVEGTVHMVRATEAIVRHIPGEEALLTVRLLTRSSEKDPRIKPTAPDLVSRLATQCNLRYRSGLPFHTKPWLINSEQDANLLIDTLIDPDRHTPVFVLTFPHHSFYSEPETPQPLIAPIPLARATLGIATVVVLPTQYTWYLTDRFGKRLSVFLGAIRIYRPGFTEDADPYEGNDLILARHLLTEKERSRLAAQMCQIAAYESRNSRNLENFMLSYSDVSKRSLKQRRKRLERKGASEGEQLELIRMQNARLEKDLAKTRKELEQLWNDHQALDERALASDEQKAAYAVRIQTLREQVIALGGNPDPDIEVPPTWGEFLDWYDLTLADRLILAPRARREIKTAKFKDAPTAARALLWLANDYREQRLHGGGGDLRTTIENGIHNDRCGSDSFQFDWQGERFSVEWHIKNGGNTRDPARCLRIYYFWHEANRQAVVASMPAHIRSRAT